MHVLEMARVMSSDGSKEIRIRLRPEPKDYCYIDIDLPTMKIVGWGETRHATHTGKTEDTHVHRVFLTKGQFNKLRSHLE